MCSLARCVSIPEVSFSEFFDLSGFLLECFWDGQLWFSGGFPQSVQTCCEGRVWFGLGGGGTPIPRGDTIQFRSGSGFCMCQCTRLCSGGLVFIIGWKAPQVLHPDQLEKRGMFISCVPVDLPHPQPFPLGLDKAFKGPSRCSCSVCTVVLGDETQVFILNCKNHLKFHVMSICNGYLRNVSAGLAPQWGQSASYCKLNFAGHEYWAFHTICVLMCCWKAN